MPKEQGECRDQATRKNGKHQGNCGIVVGALFFFFSKTSGKQTSAPHAEGVANRLYQHVNGKDHSHGGSRGGSQRGNEIGVCQGVKGDDCHARCRGKTEGKDQFWNGLGGHSQVLLFGNLRVHILQTFLLELILLCSVCGKS